MSALKLTKSQTHPKRLISNGFCFIFFLFKVGIGQFKVAWQTGSGVFLIALWYCFGDEPLFIQSFILQSKKIFEYTCTTTMNFGLNLTLLVSKRRMYHDLTDISIKSFRFPDNFAPWQASHRFKIAILQYSSGLRSSAPGISLSCNLSSCSAHAMMKCVPFNASPFAAR